VHWNLSTAADLGTIWSGCGVLGGFVWFLHRRIMGRIEERFVVQNRKTDIGITLAIRSHQRLDEAHIPDVGNGKAWVSVVLGTKEESLL